MEWISQYWMDCIFGGAIGFHVGIMTAPQKNQEKGDVMDESVEAKITPEMVTAGVSVLVGSGRFWPVPEDWAMRELVQDILQAALENRQEKP